MFHMPIDQRLQCHFLCCFCAFSVMGSGIKAEAQQGVTEHTGGSDKHHRKISPRSIGACVQTTLGFPLWEENYFSLAPEMTAPTCDGNFFLTENSGCRLLALILSGGKNRCYMTGEAHKRQRAEHCLIGDRGIVCILVIWTCLWKHDTILFYGTERNADANANKFLSVCKFRSIIE